MLTSSDEAPAPKPLQNSHVANINNALNNCFLLDYVAACRVNVPHNVGKHYGQRRTHKPQNCSISRIRDFDAGHHLIACRPNETRCLLLDYGPSTKVQVEGIDDQMHETELCILPTYDVGFLVPWGQLVDIPELTYSRE